MERAFSLRDVSAEPTSTTTQEVLDLMTERDELQQRLKAAELRLTAIHEAAYTMQALIPQGAEVPRECLTGMATFLEGLARMKLAGDNS